MLRQITLGLIVTGLVVGCGDDKPSDDTTTTTGTPGGTNATATTAGEGGVTAGEGGAGSNGTTANTNGTTTNTNGTPDGGSDGGANNGGSDGGSDGGANGGDDGGANNGGSDGGSDGGTNGGDDGGTDGGTNGDPQPGPCNEANVEVGGCEDEAVSSCICGDLPECCIDPDEEGGVNGWDDVCVEAARIEGCFDCFETHYGGGCNDDAIETCVCDSLEECCDYDYSEPSNPETGTGWTSLCRTAAIECRDEMM